MRMSDEIWGSIVGILGAGMAGFFAWLQKTNTKISNIELITDNMQKEMDRRDIPCQEHTKEMTELIRQIGQLGNDIKTINTNLTTYQQSIDRLIIKYDLLEDKVNKHEYMINDLREKHSINYKKV